MKRGNWNAFVSLSWYDSFIEFLFRFVAKTSEPLLAAGLVVSAADYLSHGVVMAGHPAFSLGWAWAQALALESSSGVVFVYALQAFRGQDKVKGAIYLALALMLAIVGGGMLLLQVNAITMGSAETAVPVLNIMRVVVSIAYIFLLRAKSIRFSDLADVREQAVTPAPAINPDVLNVLVERLDHLTVSVTQLTNPSMQVLPPLAESRASEALSVEQALPEPEEEEENEDDDNSLEGWLEFAEIVKHTIFGESKEPEQAPEAKTEQADGVSRIEQVRAILEETPDASVRDVARAIGRSKSTAHKAMKAANRRTDDNRQT